MFKIKEFPGASSSGSHRNKDLVRNGKERRMIGETENQKKEIGELREKVRELKETLDAILSGEVDAIVVSQGELKQIYTREGADQAYRSLVENIREGALTLSRNGSILYTNTRFADMVLLPRQSVSGTSLLDYICPEHRDETEKALRGILKTASTIRVRIQRGSSSLPVSISMNPLSTGDDTMISVVISDRRKDEERIRLQAGMLDAAGEAVIASDTNQKIIYWNNAATKTYGWTAEEVIGRDLAEVTAPEISKKDAREIATKLAKRETWVGQYKVSHRDGHHFVIRANDAPLFDENGKLIAIIGVSHDITEQKRTEAELLQSEEKFRSLAENQPSILTRYDRNLRVVYLSPNAESVTGLPSARFIGMTNKEMGMPEHLCSLWGNAISGVFRTGEKQDLEFDFPSSTGTKTFNLKLAPEFDDQKKIRYVIGISTDITGRKQAEDELKHRLDDLNAAYKAVSSAQEELRQNVEDLTRSKRQLYDALTEKEMLLSEIHHRVKNNLTAFISLLCLDSSYEDTHGGRALRKDLQNRARSMALVHETLYRTGKFSEVDMNIYLTTLVGQIADSYMGSAVIRTKVCAQEMVLDLARATTAGLIINELVTNSFKYAFPTEFDCMTERGEPCTIQVLLTCDDGRHVLTVNDNGRGLPTDLDPLATKSLGLRLMTFLARHQLRAEIEVLRDKGIEYIFRLNERDEQIVPDKPIS